MALPLDKLGTIDAHASTVTDAGGLRVPASFTGAPVTAGSGSRARVVARQVVARNGRAGVV
jgi:hypothetical protein